MFCSKCGKQNEDGAQFCVQCGNPLTPGAGQGMANDNKLENLYQLARRAKDDNNSENAQKYYDMILPEDPNSWEAAFYSVYFKAMNCKIAQIQSAAISVSNCIDTVLKLVKEHVDGNDVQNTAIAEVAAHCIIISSLLFNGAVNHYNGIDSQIRSNYRAELVNNCCAARDILYTLGDQIDASFGDRKELQSLMVQAWKEGIADHKKVLAHLFDKELNNAVINKYVNKIKKYDASYEPPEVGTVGGGCYVATAVYHSYDCPQVWTLRRFRDDTLAASWYGRAFVRLYYAVSPTLVRWFGETAWFQKLWRGPLDRLVAKLQAQGVESTPYEDRPW